jgi:hypothetical protein
MSKIDMYAHRFAIWTILTVILMSFSCSARADSSTAGLSIFVTDSSGAVVPAAHLVLRNSDTNQTQQSDSGKDGLATFSFLKPGHYSLMISKDTFANLVVDRILLNVGDEKQIQVVLKVGQTAQTITVDGSGLSVNTTDASVSTVIDRKFVSNIPLNGRSFQDLISMTPGVVTQSPQARSSLAYNGDFSVNGQRTESNYYTVDGVSGNISAGNGYGGPQAATSGSLAGTTALGTTQSLLSVDALQEFRVQSSTYSAEFGRNPGGQFSLATRAGTNAFHGSAFDYLRNDFFDANDWFSNHYDKSIAALRQNDFGGTLGGPVILPGLYNGRDKSFAFLSYEGLRLTQPRAASLQYVPDSFMRQQAPVALQPILNAFPLQNGHDYGSSTSPSLAQFIAPYSVPSLIDAVSARGDHTFGSKLAVFFRFGYTPSFTESRTLSVLTKNEINSQTYTLGATSQLTAQTTNEFRLGYARSDATVAGIVDGFGGAEPADLAKAAAEGTYTNPSFYLSFVTPGIGSTALTSSTASNRSRQWNLVDTVSILKGHHLLKVGADFRRIVSPITPSSPLVDAIYIGNASVLSNASSILILERYVGSTPVFNQFSAFAQDEWHVTPHLNLSYGLRWEIAPPPSDAHGNDAYTVSGNINNPQSLTLAPQGTPLWNTSWYNFAPRLGVAWTAHDKPGAETVIRAGGGVFFDTSNELAINGFDGVGFRAYQETFGSPLPVTTAQLDFAPSPNPPYINATIYAFPKHLQLPYTIEWSAALEQALGKSQAITFTYVGSNGRRLLQLQQLSLTALNPNFGTIFYVPSGITSNYQALQVQFQRSLSHGLQTLASYTWGHSLDYGSNDSALPTTRGNSDFDVRNSFTGGLSWDIPGRLENSVAQWLFSNWGLDGRIIARTAFPITLQGNLLTDPATGNQYYGNLDLIRDKPVYLYGSQYPGGKAINPNAFSTPNGNDPGTAPRNFVRGFGETQINLAARREFSIHDALKLQFRAEAFNVLNHPNFGYVDPILIDATFGQATQMLNSSLGTMASQYQQGGPRSMQFALKLVF